MPIPKSDSWGGETQSNHRISIGVGILIVFALLMRMYNANIPFLTSYGWRSYDSVVYAQALYLLSEPSTPECIRRVAQTNLKQAFVMEPRVVERLAVLGFRFFGVSNWWPRFFLASLWCLSALSIYALVLRIDRPSAAMVSVLYSTSPTAPSPTPIPKR